MEPVVTKQDTACDLPSRDDETNAPDKAAIQRAAVPKRFFMTAPCRESGFAL